MLLRVVYQVKDTIFWKQITTAPINQRRSVVLFIKSKIQFSESKSQPIVPACRVESGCLSSQRYNFLKANHNGVPIEPIRKGVVYQVKDTIFWKQITTLHRPLRMARLLFIKSKIQFSESKSQQSSSHSHHCRSCLSSQRYNFLKANHNRG